MKYIFFKSFIDLDEKRYYYISNLTYLNVEFKNVSVEQENFTRYSCRKNNYSGFYSIKEDEIILFNFRTSYIGESLKLATYHNLKYPKSGVGKFTVLPIQVPSNPERYFIYERFHGCLHLNTCFGEYRLKDRIFPSEIVRDDFQIFDHKKYYKYLKLKNLINENL